MLEAYYNEGAHVAMNYIDTLELIGQNCFDSESVEILELYNSKTALLIDLGQYESAINLAKSLKSRILANLSSRHSLYSTLLTHLGNSYLYIGEIDNHNLTYSEIVKLDTINGLENSNEHASALASLAYSCSIRDNLDLAIELLNKADLIASDYDRPNINFNKARAYRKMGDIEQAIKCYENAALDYRNLYGTEDWETISAELDYLNLRIELGQYTFIKDLERLHYLTSRDGYSDYYSPILEKMYLALEQAYVISGEYDKAHLALEKYKEIAIQLHGDPDNELVLAEYFGDYIQLLTKSGDWGKADQLIDSILPIIEKTDQLDRIRGLRGSYAVIKRQIDKREELESKLLTWNAENKSKLGEMSPHYRDGLYELGLFYIDADRLAEAQNINADLMDLLLRQMREVFPYLSDNAKLQYRNQTKNIINYLHRSNVKLDNDDAAFMEKWFELAATYAGLSYSQSTFKSNTVQADDTLYLEWQRNRRLVQENLTQSKSKAALDSLLRECQNIEQKLSLKKDGLEVGNEHFIQNMKRKLGKKEVAIQFVSYQDEDEVERLLAFVVSKKLNQPQLIRYDIKSEELLEMSEDELYQIIWEPIKAHLSTNARCYIVTDGALDQLSFYAFKMEDQSYLCEHDDLRFLVNLAEIEKKDRFINHTANIALFGGINYSTSNGSGLKDIPSSLAEVQGLAQSLVSWTSNLWTAEKATAKKLESLSSTDVLHISSHGSYKPFRHQLSEESYRHFPGVNPLFDSGIYLASDSTDSTGYVSAYQISNMDFSSVALATLSSCESGIGQSYTGEGVFGIRRSLLLAGADNVISSLREIPDKASKDFMMAFYAHLGEGKVDIATAFNLAQKDMIKVYPPQIWSAFILVGPGNTVFGKAPFEVPSFIYVTIALAVLCLLYLVFKSRRRSAA